MSSTVVHINNVSFDVGNVKTINSLSSLMIMAKDISNYWQEVFISISVTPENTKSLDYIARNYLILTLTSFCVSIICKS